MFLFDAPVENVKFVPANINDKEAQLLKNSARKALESSKK